MIWSVEGWACLSSFQLKGLYDRTRENPFVGDFFFLRCDGPNLQLQRFLNSVRKPKMYSCIISEMKIDNTHGQNIELRRSEGKGYKQNQHYKWTMPSVAQLQAGEQSEQTNRQKRSSHTPEEGVCSRDRLLVDSERKKGSRSGDDEEDQALQKSGR